MEYQYRKIVSKSGDNKDGHSKHYTKWISPVHDEQYYVLKLYSE